jgi:hypothetical protein
VLLVQSSEEHSMNHDERIERLKAEARRLSGAGALRFVEQLYAEGASCVIVDHIMMLPHGECEPYADELIVVYPGDERRSAIFDLIERDAQPDTVDDEEHIIDHGRGSIRLWWD